jgi:hypothetical protein
MVRPTAPRERRGGKGRHRAARNAARSGFIQPRDQARTALLLSDRAAEGMTIRRLSRASSGALTAPSERIDANSPPFHLTAVVATLATEPRACGPRLGGKSLNCRTRGTRTIRKETGWNVAHDSCPLQRRRRLNDKKSKSPPFPGTSKAGATGLEPATSGVTGRRSNQLSYAPRTGSSSMAGRSGQLRVRRCAERQGRVCRGQRPPSGPSSLMIDSTKRP